MDHPIMLPDEICNVKQLRHLIGCFKWPFPVENLTNLQTLNYIVVVFKGESKGFILDSIGRLRSLQTLCLHVFRDAVWSPTLQSLSHCQHLLQLRLDEQIGSLPTEMDKFLLNPKYLFLDGWVMEEDPMPPLEKLPKLTILDLADYYRVNKFAYTTRGFPQLEILQLLNCHVKELQVDEGGMPLIRGLYNPNNQKKNFIHEIKLTKEILAQNPTTTTTNKTAMINYIDSP
ncbi:hypothetical protein HYC85_016366 [Camellia sinensis]|uniref:Disease resistance R13L4/SHOC-2-like LRR domain-containing protein n=1 Tax=Camellia sinensis TaxID=4442 RepID=A0A7J7H352_CAMSI|nr:hypothetical protein HYC85_016366 [Camellia sinensis]